MIESYNESERKLSDREIETVLRRTLIKSKMDIDPERVQLEELRRNPSDISCRVNAGELSVSGRVSYPATDHSVQHRWKHSFNLRWEDDALRVKITDHANKLR